MADVKNSEEFALERVTRMMRPKDLLAHERDDHGADEDGHAGAGSTAYGFTRNGQVALTRRGFSGICHRLGWSVS